MKKIAILFATVAMIASMVSAPAKARGHRVGNVALAATLLTGAVVAAAVADQYGYSPVYYVPHSYGGPVYYNGYHPYRYW